MAHSLKWSAVLVVVLLCGWSGWQGYDIYQSYQRAAANSAGAAIVSFDYSVISRVLPNQDIMKLCDNLGGCK